MTLPVVLQVAAVNNAAAYDGARTVTFPGAVAAGSVVVLLGYVGNSLAPSLADVTSSVSMTGGVFQRRLDAPIRYDAVRGLTVWTAENVSAGATTISVTPGYAGLNNYCALTAIELGSVRTSASFEAAVGVDSEHGGFSVTAGPAPASGSISQADTMAIVLSMVNQSVNNANAGWLTPSGWTDRVRTVDSTQGLRAIYVATQSQTSTSAVSVTVGTTDADSFGRAAALLLIRGSIAAPAPAPPPPGPAPAPAPAATRSFKFPAFSPDYVGLTGVTLQIHAAPTTEPLLGTFIQGATGQSFVADAGKSAIIVAHNGVVAVTTGQSVRAVGQNTGNTAGFRGVILGTVIEP